MTQLDVPVVVRMSAEMHRAVQECAEAEDRSAAWIIRKAVSVFLAASPGTPQTNPEGTQR